MTEQELHVAGDRPEAQSLASPNGADAGALQGRIAELEREVLGLRGREAAWRAERGRLLEALESAETEIAQLPALRHEVARSRDAAYWLAVIQSSFSWRITAPLRAVTRALGRLRGRRAS